MEIAMKGQIRALETQAVTLDLKDEHQRRTAGGSNLTVGRVSAGPLGVGSVDGQLLGSNDLGLVAQVSTSLTRLDVVALRWLKRIHVPVARLAIFVVYFWFGFLKLIGYSPATPLAAALMQKTVGMAHFHMAFRSLALFECALGLLFLFPKITRFAVPLLLVHLLVVCSPLVLVPHLVWAKAFVPTLEGQYIIKNVLIVAAALQVAAHIRPIRLAARARG
jgi:uncharacterized membrane protein YkgB